MRAAPIDLRLGFVDDTEFDGGRPTILRSDCIGDAEPGNGGISTISWSVCIGNAEPGDGGTSTISWSDCIGDGGASTISWSDCIGDSGASTISWSDTVDGPGLGSACAPIIPWPVEDIVDDAGPDGPGDASQSINSCPDSVSDPGFGGAWSGLDTGDGSSGIDGSGCSRFVHPSAGANCGELDDGRAADDSGFATRE